MRDALHRLLRRIARTPASEETYEPELTSAIERVVELAGRARTTSYGPLQTLAERRGREVAVSDGSSVRLALHGGRHDPRN